MAHARAQIRGYIAGINMLGTLADQTGLGLIRQSARPATHYPDISVYNDGERMDVENPGHIVTTSDKRYRRFFDVAIRVSIQSNDNPEDELDALCLLIEQRIATDNSLGGGVIATDLQTVNFTQQGDTEYEVHIARMVYRVEYRVESLDPETFLS